MGSGRGLYSEITSPRSRFYHGPFGRLCRNVEGWTPALGPGRNIDDHLLAFANTHMVEVPNTNNPGDVPRASSVIAQDSAQREHLIDTFSSNVPAGYTYFGQFVDHDITFDPASSLVRLNDPARLFNFRTPRLDLDNVYGRGPEDQPYLYDHEDRNGSHVDKLLIGCIPCTGFDDLPRNHRGAALIGDKRNDENAIVSQMQLAFLKAHNCLADRARRAGHSDSFASARRTLRWLYQYIVWNDFICRIADPDVYTCGLTASGVCGGRRRWTSGFDDIYSWKRQPFMPVEFSGAAYRFGHSMVRNSYQTNAVRGIGTFVPIFDNSQPSPDDLRGFRPMTVLNTVQWDLFLPMGTGSSPQSARKIDPKLSNSLSFLHEGPIGAHLVNVLAFRNLKRGVTLDLPRGTGVARKWCIDPIDLSDDDIDALWYYVLKEADVQQSGERLGKVGSTIVCATIAGLLLGDPQSYFNVDPCWTPDDDELITAEDRLPGTEDWSLGTIIRLSGAPVTEEDVMRIDGQPPKCPPVGSLDDCPG